MTCFVHPSAEHIFLSCFHGACDVSTEYSALFLFFVAVLLLATFTDVLFQAVADDDARVEVLGLRRVDVAEAPHR